jgi:RNA polymerase sigma factor (sigma-70 family)
VLVTEPKSSSGAGNKTAFQNTAWSQVFKAGQVDSPDARQALEFLCQQYWYPIYAFLRRWGYERQHARDLTQAFFTYVIEQSLLQKADPEKGRFRSFILGTLKHFVSNQQAREHALKRGGKASILSIDEQTAEGRYAYEPASGLTPEKLFDRRWALELIGQAMGRLEEEYRRAGMLEMFAVLQPYLNGDQDGDFALLAKDLQKSEGAARVIVCRLRNRFRKLIRNRIETTVSDPEQVEMELRDLQEALREE